MRRKRRKRTSPLSALILEVACLGAFIAVARPTLVLEAVGWTPSSTPSTNETTAPTQSTAFGAPETSTHEFASETENASNFALRSASLENLHWSAVSRFSVHPQLIPNPYSVGSANLPQHPPTPSLSSAPLGNYPMHSPQSGLPIYGVSNYGAYR